MRRILPVILGFACIFPLGCGPKSSDTTQAPAGATSAPENKAGIPPGAVTPNGASTTAGSPAGSAATSASGSGAAPAGPPSTKGHKMTKTASGLEYEDLVVGKGPLPKKGQSVTVQYTGWLMNGQKFDSSYDHGQPFDFVLGQGGVIPGWDEGVATMHVGGKRVLVIPPQLGYGPTGQGPIPGNSTLKFQVELLGVH